LLYIFRQRQLQRQRKRWTISRGGVRSGSLAGGNRQHSQRVLLGASGNVTLHPMSRRRSLRLTRRR